MALVPERVELPGTEVLFVYRCVMAGCGHQDRYHDAVAWHEYFCHGIAVERALPREVRR
ncbi:hypothetical protein GCM10027174_17160 [Salinifilum aidingensis]